MYEIKNRIFLELTKTQKSALCNFLRALVKNIFNHPSPQPTSQSKDTQSFDFGRVARGEGADLILQKFIDDEKYYLEINSSRFEFLKDFIDDEKFISDAKLYIQECIKYYDYKKSQEPFRQAQKEFDKKKRKFLQDVKMSKEAPTKKQLSYYKSLCKGRNLERKDTKEASKLDLRNYIDEILNEPKTDYTDID